MNRIYNLLFKKNNNNEHLKIVDNSEIITTKKCQPIKTKCQPVEKKCSFCKQTNHTIKNCECINIEINNITDFCSNYENQINIPKVRKYLMNISDVILNRYVTKYKIKTYMYQRCSVYYDNNINPIKKNLIKNVELIIGYTCVLPLHPEIKIERRFNKHVKHTKNEKTNNDYLTPTLFIGSQIGSQSPFVGFGLKMF